MRRYSNDPPAGRKYMPTMPKVKLIYIYIYIA